MKDSRKFYLTAFTSKALALFIVILSFSTVSAPVEQSASQTTMRAIIPNPDSSTISIIDIEAEKAITSPYGTRGSSLFSGFLIACGQLATKSILNLDAQGDIKPEFPYFKRIYPVP
jgi:hypothetical protein